VVSAPVPSRSEVAKEQSTGHNNINGVVQPSGTAGFHMVILKVATH
jgi:enhancer of polycomb-like protein